MESIIFEIFYESLISISPTFIATIIPFLGAIWIYKNTNFYNAESKILKIGRDICDVLQARHKLALGVGLISYTYIDKYLPKMEEQNRNKALHMLLNCCMTNLISEMEEAGNKLDIDKNEAAKVIIAIAYERYESLVPENVNWSGKGNPYSIFGEDIITSNSYFPFGSKCYIQWINEFSSKHKDLWACTNVYMHKRLVKQFAECGGSFNHSDISNWLKQVESDIEKINNLHSNLILYVQLIDNNINYEGFKNSINIHIIYIVSIGLSGYLIPRILYDAKVLDINHLIICSLASLLFMLGIFNMLLSNPSNEIEEQKEIFIPQLLDNLKKLKVANLQFNYLPFDHLITIKKELGLSYIQTRLLKLLVQSIKEYNQLAQEFEKEISKIITPLFFKYKSKNRNVGGNSIQVQEISDNDYDLEETIEFIKTKDTNLSFSIQKLGSTRDVHKIYLKDLTSEQRADLCTRLIEFRLQSNELSSYISLKNTQSRLIKIAQKLENKFSKYKLN
jgi:hypothetical protein